MQGKKKCGPKGRDCIEKNSARTFNCSISCAGMYADIDWKDEKIKDLDLKDKKKYAVLYSEYKNFKKENVKPFRFSSGAYWNNFGEQTLQ